MRCLFIIQSHQANNTNYGVVARNVSVVVESSKIQSWELDVCKNLKQVTGRCVRECRNRRNGGLKS